MASAHAQGKAELCVQRAVQSWVVVVVLVLLSFREARSNFGETLFVEVRLTGVFKLKEIFAIVILEPREG